MGRRIDADNMVGAAEIADRLGLSHPRHPVALAAALRGLPRAPLQRLEQAMVWDELA
ncbi:MAG: hypothetical protein U5K30_01530 [Acidimicrobiales bacterium]|nr:hypothetical protein [Acidimicrobiales bacterium]